MAALAYLMLPLSGVIAFLFAADPRVRFHGMQAIVFGLLWALALYGGAALSPTLTRVVAAVGALIWVVLLGATAAGRDPALPGLRRSGARGEQRSTSGSS
jgi:uncharacterized membrane protein